MIKPEYATYRYTKKSCEASALSRVECRIPGSEISEILAVRAEVYPANCSCCDKQIDYGGRVVFSFVYADGDKRVCRAERGVEFSHRAACDEAVDECTCVPAYSAGDVSCRRDGSFIVAAAVIRADIAVYRDEEISYLCGGDNLAVNKRPVQLTRFSFSATDGEESDEFETEYFTDLLLHSETAYVKNVYYANGAAKIEGEIVLNVCALKEDDSLVSYERLIPFSVEAPAPCAADENRQTTGAEAGSTQNAEPQFSARVSVSSANLSAETSEERNKCSVRAEFSFNVQLAQYTPETLELCSDAFSAKQEVALETRQTSFRRLKWSKTYVKKIEGVAALSAPIDYTASFLAAALPKAEVVVRGTGAGAFEIEGAANARVILSDKDGMRAADLTLPFVLSETGEISSGDEAEAQAIVCGISLKQKKEGEAEAEATLKITLFVYDTCEIGYVSKAEGGEEYGEETCGMSVFVPRAGDGLWETAKALRKTPEELTRSNPDLVFPLKGKERILVYNRR